MMEELANELVEQLECVAVFTVHIGGWEIPIYESTVITWVIVLLVLLLSLFLTRNLQVHPTGKRQLFAEMLVTKIEGFITDMVGEEAKGYVPYLSTVLIYLAFANLIGLFGVKPPTKDMTL